MCPNEKEARIALQDKESGLESLSKNLIAETGSEMLIMKLGAQGFIAFDPNLEEFQVNLSQHCLQIQ